MKAAAVLLQVENCSQLSELYTHTHKVMGSKDFRTTFQKSIVSFAACFLTLKKDS